MQQIIDGLLYDTETAECLGSYSFSFPNDFRYVRESLYRTKKGTYFLAGEGGSASKYRQEAGINQWCGGERIIPLTKEEAKQWVERNLSASSYIEIFAAPDLA